MQHTQALAENAACNKSVFFTQNIVYAREDTAIRSVSISHKRKKSANCLFFGRQTAEFYLLIRSHHEKFCFAKGELHTPEALFCAPGHRFLPVLFSSVNNKCLTIYKEWCRVKVSKITGSGVIPFTILYEKKRYS